MKLSIITICYNEPDVERTCESIVNQTWQDFEWIVVDGGSNKETLDIFEKYKHRIDKFVSEKDNGIYNACNKGINMSSGKYLIFMNAGDCFYNKEVLNCVAPVLGNSGAGIIFGEVERAFKNEKKKDYVTCTPQIVDNDFFITNNLCTQGVFIEKSLFDIYGSYDESYKICADYEKWVKFYKNGVRFHYVPVIIAEYDFNGVSSSPKTKKLSASEHNEIKQKYFTDEEIIKSGEAQKMSYSILENIFSMKNNSSGSHKIITILGLHIKLRRKK